MTREIERIGSAYGTAVRSGLVNVMVGREVEHRGAWALAVPYAPAEPEDRSKRCVGKDNTCKGYRIKGSDLCIGHSNSQAAVVVAEEEVEDEVEEVTS